MDALTKIKRAHVAIARHPSFCRFMGLLTSGDVIINDRIKTAATDGWNVTYNSGFISSLRDEECRLVVLHENLHKAYQHLLVWKHLWQQDRDLANVSMDHFVNLALIEEDAGAGFLRMPAAGIQPDPKFSGWSVDKIFAHLLREKKQQQQQQQGQGSQSATSGPGAQPAPANAPPAAGSPGSGIDEHDWEGAAAVPQQVVEERAKTIQQAVLAGQTVASRRRGTGAGSSLGAFSDLLAPRVNWREALADWMQDVARGCEESSWRKVSRRHLANDTYLPGLTGVSLDTIVVGIDTSGSIWGSDDMQQFAAELASIVERVSPARTIVAYWDDGVRSHQTFEAGAFSLADCRPAGGGGTDGRSLFRWMENENIRPDCIVVLTDGYVGHWPNTIPAPTLWAITEPRIVAPVGTTVHL